MSLSARETILQRITAALGDDRVAADEPLARPYRRVGDMERRAVVALFAQRVAEYRAVVVHCSVASLSDTIAAACRRQGVQRLVIPTDLPPAWRPTAVELLPDEDLTIAALDTSDGVLSGCALGIAQTGTIVLDGGAVQGRRVLTLLPDYLLCVIHQDQIVELVPEAFARLGPALRDRHRPLTFISGPSATSDIELNRIEGVHGPRTLEVIVVGTSERETVGNATVGTDRPLAVHSFDDSDRHAEEQHAT